MNDDQTTKINIVLRNTRSTITDFQLVANGYHEYACDDTNYTLYIADIKCKIDKLVKLGIPVTTKLQKLHGIAIIPFEHWCAVRKYRISCEQN